MHSDWCISIFPSFCKTGQQLWDKLYWKSLFPNYLESVILKSIILSKQLFLPTFYNTYTDISTVIHTYICDSTAVAVYSLWFQGGLFDSSTQRLIVILRVQDKLAGVFSGTLEECHVWVQPPRNIFLVVCIPLKSSEDLYFSYKVM